jgi:phosphopantothenoylcysteine synthetase/decarboxylase
MKVIVTFGPTYEPLDEVRRLTNFSTGRLGTDLSNFLASRGHEVIALRGHYSTHVAPIRAKALREFTTTENLLTALRECSRQGCDALFHAAAVSDFKFGSVLLQTAAGLKPLSAGKFSTNAGRLLAELVPTPKIIAELRTLFPRALLCGWKYEVDGTQEDAIGAARRQMESNRTDWCVANGRAYGVGFGLVSSSGSIRHMPDSQALCQALGELLNA